MLTLYVLFVVPNVVHFFSIASNTLITYVVFHTFSMTLKSVSGITLKCNINSYV